MTELALLLPALLSATLDVPAGASLDDAVARARPGDVLRLGPGEHRGALGRVDGLRVEGAGVDMTRLVVTEGKDGAIAVGRLWLAGLTVEAGAARAALKVLDGDASLEDVALVGGAVGAFVDGGRLSGTRVRLVGGYGLLVRTGEVTLIDGIATGGARARAGAAVLRGRLDLRRFAVTGPFEEAGITVTGGSAALDEVVIRAPGPAGLVVHGGEVTGRDVEIAGAREVASPELRGDGILGDCLQLLRGRAFLASGSLSRCGGAAASATRGALRLDGMEIRGGSAGALVLLDDARGDLRGNWVTGRGPGLVAAAGARAEAEFNRWRLDPVFWVDCGSGSRVRLVDGERTKEPCSGDR